MPNWLSWLFSYLQDYFTAYVPSVTELFFVSNIIYMVLVIMVFVYSFSKRNRERNGFRLLFAFSVLTMLLIIYNPFLRLVFYLFPSTSDAVFARFWLLCPLWMIMAFTLVSFVSDIKSSYLKNAGIIVMAVIIVFSGKSLYSLSMMTPSNNTYKIRTESIDMANGLMKLSEGNPVKLFIMIPDDENNGKFENGGSIAEGIAQYNGYIEVYSEFYSDEVWANYYLADTIPETGETSEYYINKSLMYKYLQYNFDYVAWPVDDLIVKKMEQCGFKLLGEYGGYNVFSYVISDRAIQIADSIMESSAGQTTTVLLLSFEDLTNIRVGIRYYTDEIFPQSSKINEEKWYSYTTDSQRSKYLKNILEKSFERAELDYVVWFDEYDISDYMDSCGYETYCNTDGFVLYIKSGT